MRTRRWLGSAIVLAAALVLEPAGASADGGGAYIDLLHSTHYLPGQIAHAKTSVSVPAREQDVLERGPFFLYVTPYRKPITKGEPIPAGALRVATFTITHDRGSAFTMTASFTVPDLPGDFYALGMCNDPCTIAGFREPLWGQISIVQTTREAQLLNEQEHLKGDIYGLKRKMRKQVRVEADLERQLSYAGMEQRELRTTIEGLRTKLANVRAEVDRSPFPWFLILLTILAVVLVGTAAVVSKRRRRMQLHQIPPMLDERRAFERPKAGTFR